MFGLLCTMGIFAFELTVCCYSYIYWYKEHTDNLKLVTWDRVASIVLTFKSALQIIVYIVQEYNRYKKEVSGTWIFYIYFMNQTLVSLFMAIYSVFGFK